MEKDYSAKPARRGLSPAIKVLIGTAGGACISGLLLYFGVIGIPLTFLMFEALVVGGIVYGYGDLYGAAAMALVAETGITAIAGPIGGVLMLTLFTLPYAALVYACQKRLPFFRILEVSMASLGAGVVVSLLIVVKTFGSDIGKLISDLMNASFSALDADSQKGIAELYASFYAAVGYTLDTSNPAALLSSIASSMENMVKVSMPFMLVALVVENAALGSLITCFIRVKRGIEGAEYQPVSKWRLPAKITIGVLLLLAVGFTLSKTAGTQGQVVWVTAVGVAYIACLVQTIASLYDKLSLVGIRFIFRLLWMVLLVFSFDYLPMIYGFFSGIFGRYGLIRQLMHTTPGDTNDKNDKQDSGIDD